MDRHFATHRYRTVQIDDDKEGFTGLALLCSSKEQKEVCVAKIIFWDACGQFYLETFGSDVPLPIVEELVAEAKAAIKVR